MEKILYEVDNKTFTNEIDLRKYYKENYLENEYDGSFLDAWKEYLFINHKFCVNDIINKIVDIYAFKKDINTDHKKEIEERKQFIINQLERELLELKNTCFENWCMNNVKKY